MQSERPFRPIAFAAALLLLSAAAGLPLRAAPQAAGVDGESLNVPAEVHLAPDGRLTISYRGESLFVGQVSVMEGNKGRDAEAKDVDLSVITSEGRGLEQRITLTAVESVTVYLVGLVLASDQTIAVETRGAAQERFPLIRTTAGRSANRRNNAVYDRRWDWLLSGPADGSTRIELIDADQGEREYVLFCGGEKAELVFRPLFYQRHKNLRWYEPWTYDVWKGSIAGWCSWWAYRRDFDQATLEKVVEVLAAANLADFGYRYVQIDDTFQTSMGLADGWLDWDAKKFPAGAEGTVSTIRAGGFEPGIWVYSAFHDEEAVRDHPDWFVRNAEGELFKGPWVAYGLDGNNEEALEAVVRRTERGFRDLGFTYVKIDSLRHLLYDSYHHAREHLAAEGATPAETFRRYLGAAREELGRGTFVLSCWGVLPESIGIADACRLGGDGFGAATLQQYNSWNGLVWRNDPDHCDVLPHWKPAEEGNVTAVEEVEASATDAIQRPCLVSMAGAMLMLSDRWEVYANPANLEGIKRAAPIVFTVPGQLYDFNPEKTDRLAAMERTEILEGGPPSPIDADQTGLVCDWWMMEIERPYERWNVLARFAWGDVARPAQEVRFADLGLREDTEYLVYEFWSGEFLGASAGNFVAPELAPGGTEVFALRERADHPQLVSTSRHITQGAVDLIDVRWNEETNTLSGRSAVVRDDRYELVVHVPEGFEAGEGRIGGRAVDLDADGPLRRLGCTPAATGPLVWEVVFAR